MKTFERRFAQAFAGRKALLVLWIVTAAAVLALTAKLSIFMFVPQDTSCSIMPNNAFLTRHSCFSAYVTAGDVSARPGENVYDPANYPRGDGDAGRHIPLGAFDQDRFSYGPVFLLVPRALLLASQKFSTLRGIWFVVETVAVLGALGLMAAYLGGRRGFTVALLIPLCWGALSGLLAIQTGNVQPVIVAITVLSMIAFERGHPAAGGAMLAFAAGTKLYPGLFFLVLLVQRRWRDALWTAAFGVVYVLAITAASGPGPVRDFVSYELPRLASGEAFDFLKRDLATKALNFSVHGLPYRFEALGLLHDPDRVAAVLSRVYTAMLVVTALYVGWKAPRPSPGEGDAARGARVILWFALFDLAVLRSPFLPPYGFVGTVWMVAVWAPYTKSLPRAAALFVPAYLLLNFLVAAPKLPAIAAGALVVFFDVGLNVAAIYAALKGKLIAEESTRTPLESRSSAHSGATGGRPCLPASSRSR